MTGDRRKPTRNQQVETLAASIRDVEHFEQILADVDPKMKRQVRELLQQYVTFPMPDPLNPLAAPVVVPEYRSTLVRKL